MSDDDHDKRHLPSGKTLYTLAEAADLLRINRTTLWRYIRAGRLPTIKPDGRRLVHRDDLEAFLRQGPHS
jgi:excisionase family DNA binding protein